MEISVEPTKTYAVTTSGSCTVTDADGLELCTAIAGSQTFFVATTPTVTVSDDGAKVSRATFNYALAALGLLGGGADKLPAGYTRLEYVDIVKLFSHDSTITTNALDVELDAQFVYNGQEYVNSNLLKSTSIDYVYGTSRVSFFVPSYYTVGLRMVNEANDRECFPSGGNDPTNLVISRYKGKIPSYTTRKQVHIHDCGYDMDGKFYQFEPTAIVNNVNWGKMQFGAAPTASNGNHWRLWRCSVRQNGVLTADLIPCMRSDDGCPGLWCKVYKKFYEQSPVATLALWGESEDNGLFYVDPNAEDELSTDE